MILSATTRQCGKQGKHEISSPPFASSVRFVIILLTFRKENGDRSRRALARESLSDERRQTITLLDVWTSCSRRDYGQTTRGGQNNFVTVDDSKENEGQREYSGNCRAAHDSSNGGVARDQNIFRMGDVCAGGRGRKRVVGRRTDMRGNPLPDFGARQRRIYHQFIFELNGLL